MGVIRVNVEAMKTGFRMGDPDWANLGQGQPEVGEMAGAPPRFDRFSIEPGDHGYGAIEGIPELRETIANHYNRLYRKGKRSQYSAENVAVAGGGRLALTRAGAALDTTRLGYFTPDYTAYEDLMTTFHRIDPFWIGLLAKDGFRIPLDKLEGHIVAEEIGALLVSNPCNPTGVVISGRDLAGWVEMSRRRKCTLLMDEFYSHYVFRDGIPGPGPVSAAEFIEDVDTDPVVIFDGLTKCFRYPGWRIGWVIAPRDVIRNLTAAGSFIDGGSSRPMQRAAIEVLEEKRADQETGAVRTVFAAKQRLTLDRLTAMGVEFPAPPEGTFYALGSVAKLPAPLSTGEGFMHEAFKHRVLTVPGEYFDVNPNKARGGTSPLQRFVRFSFGPPREVLESGLDRLEKMVASWH